MQQSHSGKLLHRAQISGVDPSDLFQAKRLDLHVPKGAQSHHVLIEAMRLPSLLRSSPEKLASGVGAENVATTVPVATSQTVIRPPSNVARRLPSGLKRYASFDNLVDVIAARSRETIPAVRAVIEGARAKNLIAAGFIEREANVSAIAKKHGILHLDVPLIHGFRALYARPTAAEQLGPTGWIQLTEKAGTLPAPPP
jgi:hypothetical protein